MQDEESKGVGPAPAPAPEAEVEVEAGGALRAQAAELRDRLLRQAADFENYRKRVAREREETVCFANERLIADLLPVLDNLERALATSRGCADAGALAEGVRLIGAQLKEVLVRCGLAELPAVGQPFDPNLHEAVGVVPPGAAGEGAGEGTVGAQVRPGYSLKGKVIRPAQVLVALAPGDRDQDEG